jgi:hypothetical protein
VRIVARARRMRDVDSLRAAGAHDVLVPEAEGAYRFAETVLSELGISQERVAAVVLAERSRLS